jgi:hypothetical protein
MINDRPLVGFRRVSYKYNFSAIISGLRFVVSWDISADSAWHSSPETADTVAEAQGLGVVINLAGMAEDLSLIMTAPRDA